MAQTTTFTTLKSSIIRRNNDDVSGNSIADVEEAIKDSLRNLAQVRDWSFFKDRVRVTTSDDEAAGTISINTGSKILTGSATSWQAAGSVVDKTWAFKLNGENVDYYVSSSTVTNTSLIFTSSYVGTGNLSAKTFKAFKRAYDLNANTREVHAIINVRNTSSRLLRLNTQGMLEYNLMRNSGGEPMYYSIENKRSDTVRQLWLYPYPDSQYQYDIIYSRWPTIPSADSDVIDWPDHLMPLLREAVLMELGAKRGDMMMLQRSQMAYSMKLDAAINGDMEDSGRRFIGGTSNDRAIFTLDLDVASP